MPVQTKLQHIFVTNSNNNSPKKGEQIQNNGDDDNSKNNNNNQIAPPLPRHLRRPTPEQEVQVTLLQHQLRYISDLNKYNLHARVLFESCGFTCVPYCTVDSRFNVNGIIPSAYNANNTPTFPVVTIFIGQLPLVPRVEEIALLLIATCNVLPTRIWIPSGANTTQQGKRASPLVQVDVPAECADRVVANLHLRAWFDQTCFYVAKTKEQIVYSHKYNKFLTNFTDLRFNDRPRSAITVVRGTNGDRANAKNAYNPLCDCAACNKFLEDNTDFSFMDQVYVPEVTSEVVGNNQWRNFDVDALLRTHAFLRPQDLFTPLEEKHFAPVSAEALFKCRERGFSLWPFYKWKTYDTDAHEMSCNARRLTQL